MASPESSGPESPSPEWIGDQPSPTRIDLLASARRVLTDHWRDPGFTCPNASTYPRLWLWDSCFHAVVWAELGDADRAVTELSTAMSGQGPDGFVPHLGYFDGGSPDAALWGRQDWSSITQPPIYGWTAAELLRRGIELPPEVVDRCRSGLRFLLHQRARSRGDLVEIVHPWESGCDHSPRWDDLMVRSSTSHDPASHDPYDPAVWYERKGALVGTIRRSVTGAALSNPAFAVGSVAFSAILSWAATELGRATGDEGLSAEGAELGEALQARWDGELRTYVDDGPTATGSGRARTAEALLPLLVEQRQPVLDAAIAELTDTDALGARFGPAGVDRREPTYRRHSYWRGPSWPQIDLLLWLGVRRSGSTTAASLGSSLVHGAWASGWAEYWDPDDASPGGAVPQSWSTVACLVEGTQQSAPVFETH